MLQTKTFLERDKEEELIRCYSNAQALNQGRGNDLWRTGILTHPHMTLGNHAQLWSQHRKREVLHTKRHKLNHLHCKSAQHLIFLSHLSREEDGFESPYISHSAAPWSAARRRAPYTRPASREKMKQNKTTLPTYHRVLFQQRQPTYRSWKKGFMLLISETCRCSAFGKQRQLRVLRTEVLAPEHLSTGCSGTFSRSRSPFQRPRSFRWIKGSGTVTFFCGS